MEASVRVSAIFLPGRSGFTKIRTHIERSASTIRMKRPKSSCSRTIFSGSWTRADRQQGRHEPARAPALPCPFGSLDARLAAKFDAFAFPRRAVDALTGAAGVYWRCVLVPEARTMKRHITTLCVGGVLALALIGAAVAGPLEESPSCISAR